jgi:hypothetical protein
MAEKQKYTKGYLNTARWPIQLVISRLNATMHLQPGDFILDTQGRKINDPFFDIYVKNGQLSKEYSDAPVPLISIPAPAPLATTAGDGQSVRSVTEFTMDKKGFRQPVMPQPAAVATQAVNKPAIQAMSMDEARQAGLVRKVREVPEDYGVPDTNSASPPRTPPPMKFAVDTDQAAKPTGALPAQLKAALPRQALKERHSLQQALAQSAQNADVLDSETGFTNAVTQNVPAAAGIRAGQPGKIAESADGALPPPQLDEPLPAPEEEEAIPEPSVKPVVVPESQKFACIECGGNFASRPALVAHALKRHGSKAKAILAAYPE